jgi:hypothetical protein
MKRVVALMCAFATITGALAASGTTAQTPTTSPASTVDPIATIAYLETRVAALSTSAAVQATQITELQTAIAVGPSAEPTATNVTALPDVPGDVRGQSGSGSNTGLQDDGTYTLGGTIVLTGDSDNVLDTGGEGSMCFGDGGYDDFYPGQNAVVKDGGGDILAVGELTESELILDGTVRKQCEFTILITGIPEERFYVVEISHRGELTYSFDDLEEVDWKLELVIGD